MRRFACWLLFVSTLVWVMPARAAAWIEATVVSDAVTVQVARDGRATVHHTLALRVRGGPLKTWTVQGVDRDAEPLSDAYVVNANSEKANNVRRELILARGDDDSLQIDVADDKGLRQGTYLLEFGYHTDFRTTKMLRPRGAWLELAWVGARFTTGLDGAKVTFRIPAASTAPRIAQDDVEPNVNETPGTPADSFVSSVRRGHEFDEVELLRAHVAQGEPVLWRIWINPVALDLAVASQEKANRESLDFTAVSAPRDPSRGWHWTLAAAVVAAVWMAALLTKLRRHADDCFDEKVSPRALIPLGPVVRVTLSGGLLAAAIVLAWPMQSPNLATACNALAMLLAMQRRPHDERVLRGPGVWLPLTDTEAFATERPPLRGRFLDITRWHGRTMLAVYAAAMLAALAIVSRHSPYDAALLGLFAPIPLPLFVTALGSELPHARRARKRDWLSQLHRKLTREQQLKVVACARFGDGESRPDDLRLRVIAPVTVDGLVSIEVGYLELCPEPMPTVCVLIRAKEGSSAQRVWQSRLVWQRGRRADERLAVHELSWPSITAAVQAVNELVAELRDQSSSDVRSPKAPSNWLKSSGRGAKQSKAGTISSPSQTTRRA